MGRVRQWRILPLPSSAPGNVVRALAIDPGKTTGFAVRKDADTVAVCQCGESGWVRMATDYSPIDVLVFETYTTSGPRTADSTAGMYAIGDIRTALRYATGGALAVVPQTPQRRLAFVERAKRAGAVDHEVDALAHLLAYEFSC